MLRELRRIIEEAIRRGLTEGLGERGERNRPVRRASKSKKRYRSFASPEEQAARAAMRRISFN